MNPQPLLQASLAALYIVGVVGVMQGMLALTNDGQSEVFAPVVMLSLLVLSVSVMAYLFFYKPVTLYVEGQKQEAVTFFLKIVAYFAVFVALAMLIFVTVPFPHI
ncbi:MAG: hypothetical protein AAB439_03935 [Patescibacteria group bacterium]